MPYDEDFLTRPLAPPRAIEAASAPLDYTHFTVTMNPSRRLAWWVAWNIDGARLFPDIPRASRFYPDDRIPLTEQTTDDVYDDNNLDRGHLARRSDLLWGTLQEATQANDDSFCFTNISPQLNIFNQSGLGGVWGTLENAVLDMDGLDDRRLTLFAGPVLADDDPPYRDLVLVPRDHWKIVVYSVAGQLRHRAFVLTQELDQLETSFLEEFRTYQVDLVDLAGRTRLDFGGLAGIDEAATVTSSRPHLVRDASEVDW